MINLSLGSWRIWHGKVWAAIYLVPRDTIVLENLSFEKLKLLHDEFLYDESFKFLPQLYIYMLARLGKAYTYIYCLWALSVVKLCWPLGIGHAVKIKIHVHSPHILRFYPGSMNPHIFHSDPSRKSSTPILGESPKKYICLPFEGSRWRTRGGVNSPF
jgi:hypothetical protein